MLDMVVNMRNLIIIKVRTLMAGMLVVISCGSVFAGTGDFDTTLDATKGKQEAVASAVVPSTNAVVVTGYQNLAGDVNDEVYTVKYASDGTVVWRAKYKPSAGD